MGPVMLVSPEQTFPPWWDGETAAYRVVEDLQIARVLADIPARLDMILEEVVVHLGGPFRSSLPVRTRSRGPGLNVEFLKCEPSRPDTAAPILVCISHRPLSSETTCMHGICPKSPPGL